MFIFNQNDGVPPWFKIVLGLLFWGMTAYALTQDHLNLANHHGGYAYVAKRGSIVYDVEVAFTGGLGTALIVAGVISTINKNKI